MNVMQTRVPPEIIDRIIDHLHNDKTGLASCALVCAEWSSSARFHLFRQLIFLPEDIPPFLRLLDNNQPPGHLRIGQEAGLIGLRPWGAVGRLPSVATFVTGIKLSYFEWYDALDPPFLELRWACRAITRLDLKNIFFGKFSFLVDILCALPALKYLECNCLMFDSTEDEEARLAAYRKQLPFTLASLNLRLPELCLLKWLCHQTSIRNLRSLWLDCTNRDRLPRSTLLLSLIGPSLHHLTVALPYAVENDEESVIDLSRCTELRSISFGNPYIQLPSKHSFGLIGLDKRQFFPWIDSVLLSITSQHLTSITFRLRMITWDDFHYSWPLDRVRLALDKKSFRDLQNLVFQINHGIDTPEFTLQHIREKFSDHHRRGIIRIDTRTEGDDFISPSHV